MNSDDAVRQLIKTDVLQVQGRTPRPDEIARALRGCHDTRRFHLRRVLHDFLPAAVLAAACSSVVISGLPAAGSTRPLASELTRTIPDDAGDTFIVVMVATGDFFRSADR